ncbi:hypothetical protein CRENBAI_011335, partial [Crenichthys baileyi]
HVPPGGAPGEAQDTLEGTMSPGAWGKALGLPPEELEEVSGRDVGGVSAESAAPATRSRISRRRRSASLVSPSYCPPPLTAKSWIFPPVGNPTSGCGVLYTDPPVRRSPGPHPAKEPILIPPPYSDSVSDPGSQAGGVLSICALLLNKSFTSHCRKPKGISFPTMIIYVIYKNTYCVNTREPSSLWENKS